MRPIFVTRHAMRRASQREISFTEVRETILQPDLEQKARHGRLKVIKEFQGRQLVVVYLKRRQADVVVTAYWRGHADFLR